MKRGIVGSFVDEICHPSANVRRNDARHDADRASSGAQAIGKGFGSLPTCRSDLSSGRKAVARGARTTSANATFTCRKPLINKAQMYFRRERSI